MALVYKKINKPYSIRQLAHLAVDGVGFNGTYFFKGYIVLEKQSLYLTAKGFTAPMQTKYFGDYKFFMTALVFSGNNLIIKQPLVMGLPGTEHWGFDEYKPIGSTRIALPAPNSNMTLLLQGGYECNITQSMVNPVPPYTNHRIPLSLESA